MAEFKSTQGELFGQGDRVKADGRRRPNRQDLTGQTFHRLTVLGFAEIRKGFAYWKCRCVCGAEKVVAAAKLVSDRTKSCGCHKKDEARARAHDLTGRRFGRLEVVRRSPRAGTWWECRCDCGGETTVKAAYLTDGTTSCGCVRAEVLAQGRKKLVAQNTTHGMWESVEFKAWQSMRTRCYNKNTRYYHNYGGRGIAVCEGWRDSFEAFFADLGPRPSPKHSVDRQDNDGGYTCGRCGECQKNGWVANCRWATKKEQGRNQRFRRWVKFNGESLTVAEWAERTTLPAPTLLGRLDWGWPPEVALTQPLGTQFITLGIKRGPVHPRLRARAMAVSAVSRAVKRGVLVRPPRCQFPGCDEKVVQAHHYRGYAPENRLAVVWLCRPHHRLAEKDSQVSERAAAASQDSGQ